MNVSGKCYLNVKETKCKNGDILKMFSTKVGKDGKLYASVRFTGEYKDKAQTLDSSKTYELDIQDGFLSNDPYNDKDNLTIVVLKATILSAKDKKQKEEQAF